MTESKVDEAGGALDSKLLCLQSLLLQLGASMAARAIGEARSVVAKQAELIEAAGRLVVRGDGRAYFESGADTERFRAALAACTPAKPEGR